MIDPASADPLPGVAAAATPVEKKEVLFHGVPASPGICRGRVLVFGAAHTDFHEIDPIPIAASDVDAEGRDSSPPSKRPSPRSRRSRTGCRRRSKNATRRYSTRIF